MPSFTIVEVAAFFKEIEKFYKFKMKARISLSRSYKTFFLRFLFFGVKLGHFTIDDFFLHVTNVKAYQQKTEKIFVSEEKKFYRIGSF